MAGQSKHQIRTVDISNKDLKKWLDSVLKKVQDFVEKNGRFRLQN